MLAEQSIRHWSTKTVPTAMRFDYWLSIMRTALWPVTDYTQTSADFAVELQESPLGCLSSMLETIDHHQARRTRRDVERTEERSYHLFVSLEPTWHLAHAGHCEQLGAGDVVLVGEGEHVTSIPRGFHGVILKCPASWLRTWLPDPELLAGMKIAGESRWGAVLSPMIRQMTPAFAAAPPLPSTLLTDQLGALLALAAGESQSRTMPKLRKRIEKCILERCCEAQLTAADVADAINVPPQVVHQILAGGGRTFASLLLDARIGVALRLLGMRAFDRLSLPELAARAGFSSVRHFAHVVRRRTGHHPQDLRRPSP